MQKTNLNTQACAALSQKHILLSCAEDSLVDLQQNLEIYGAKVSRLPLIEITALELKNPPKPSHYDWIVFTSRNGVRHFCEQMNSKLDYSSIRFACVGPATARLLEDFGLRADCVTDSGAPKLLCMLRPLCEGLKVLVAQGSKSDAKLAMGLKKIAACVRIVNVYATKTKTQKDTAALETLCRSNLDAVIFASGSAAESFVEQALDQHLKSKNPLIYLSIGAASTLAARRLGLSIAAQAETPSPEALMRALCEVFKRDA